MKCLISILILVLIPTLTWAQLNDDGKSRKSVRVNHGYNTIAYSAAIPFAPFGIKYQYCKSYGFYTAFKTDFDLIDGDYILTAGAAKTIGQKMNAYVGTGYDFSFSEPVLEAGCLLKFGKYVVDIGAGYLVGDIAYGTLGFGFNL